MKFKLKLLIYTETKIREQVYPQSDEFYFLGKRASKIYYIGNLLFEFNQNMKLQNHVYNKI